MLRETPEDLKNEAEILDALCQKFSCQWRKLGNGGKYRIDAVLYRKTGVGGFAEVKDYKNKPHLLMNIKKYIEGTELAAVTEKPFLFVFRHQGKVGYIKVHGGGAWSDIKPELVMAGGTPLGRQPNPDDIEPLFKFKSEDVIWI